MPLVFSLNVMCYETATICKSLAHLVCLLQVYGLAMYVEEAAARQEVSRLKGAGFFADGESSVEKMCSAISAMNCHKVRLMHAIELDGFAIADTHTVDVALARLVPVNFLTNDFHSVPWFIAEDSKCWFNRFIWTCKSDALSQLW